MSLRGATPDAIHEGVHWERPSRFANTLPLRVGRRHLADARPTALGIAARDRGIGDALRRPTAEPMTDPGCSTYARSQEWCWGSSAATLGLQP